MQIYFTNLVVALLALVLSGCSSTSSVNPTRGFIFEGPNVYLDDETEQHSNAIYYYLRGELALQNENFDEALEFLEEANKYALEDDSILHTQLAMLLVQSRELEKAFQIMKDSSGKDSDPEDKLFFAGIADALDKYDESLTVYKEIIDGGKADESVYLLAANESYSSGDIDSAISILEKAKKSYPKYSLVYYYLGNLYREADKLDISERALSKAVKLEPQNKKLKLSYFLTLLREGKDSEVQRQSKQAVKEWGAHPATVIVSTLDQLLQNKDQVAASQLLSGFIGPVSIDDLELKRHVSMVQIEKRDLLSGIRSLFLLLAQYPDDSRARYYLGSALAAVGMRKRAVSELAKIGPNEEMFIEARTFSSFLSRQLDELDQAEQSIREALEALPEADANLQFYLIDILREKQKYKDARDIALDLIEQYPDNEKALYLYGTLLHQVGEVQESNEVINRVLSINANNAQALNFLAYALAEQGDDLKRAEELVSKAIDLYPEDGYYLDTLGWIYVKQGKTQQALPLLARAVNLTGDDIVIMEHYADCLASVGNREKAIRFYLSVVQRKGDQLSQDEKEAVARAENKISELFQNHPALKEIAQTSGLYDEQ